MSRPSVQGHGTTRLKARIEAQYSRQSPAGRRFVLMFEDGGSINIAAIRKRSSF